MNNNFVMHISHQDTQDHPRENILLESLHQLNLHQNYQHFLTF